MDTDSATPRTHVSFPLSDHRRTSTMKSAKVWQGPGPALALLPHPPRRATRQGEQARPYAPGSQPPASPGCPGRHTPAGCPPIKPFPGFLLRARGRPLLRPPLCSTPAQEGRAPGPPIRRLPEARAGAGELAREASKILMHSVVRSCHTRLWQIIPDARRGKMEL